MAIMATAYVPARYVCRYIVGAPSRRDITQPVIDFGWRTSSQLFRNSAILAALTGLAIFIFTSTAARFARSPTFWPILIAACGMWAIFSVLKAYFCGQIEPFARGFYNTYERATQPKRFWASMAWNALLGSLLLFGAFKMLEQAPLQALEDRCYDTQNVTPAREGLSACNQLIGRGEEADSDKARVVAARGTAYYRLGDYRHAMSDYTTAIRLDPSETAWRYNRGLVDEQLDDKKAAIADYSAAVQNSKDNADAYLNRGLIFLDTGKFDQAIADFSRAHELHPNDAMPLADRGITYAWKKDQARAERDLIAAHVIDPSNSVLLQGQALLRINAGDINAAIDRLSAALIRNPADAWSLEMRAEAYRRLGQNEKSRSDIDKLQRLSKDTDRARLARH